FYRRLPVGAEISGCDQSGSTQNGRLKEGVRRQPAVHFASRSLSAGRRSSLLEARKPNLRLSSTIPSEPCLASLVERVWKYAQVRTTAHPQLAEKGFCSYTNWMRITFDPAKRERTLAERGLDFEDASLVFEGVTVETKIGARTTMNAES